MQRSDGHSCGSEARQGRLGPGIPFLGPLDDGFFKDAAITYFMFTAHVRSGPAKVIVTGSNLKSFV